jgi:hypothetical protein
VTLVQNDAVPLDVAVQVAFGKAKFVTGFSRWVKGQAQGLEPGAFKLWVSWSAGFSLYSYGSAGFSLYSPTSMARIVSEARGGSDVAFAHTSTAS